MSFETLENGYSGAWLNANYGDVAQRWLLVCSEQAKKSEQKTLDRKMLKESTEACKSFKKLTRQRFSCASDAAGALAVWLKANPSVDLAIQGLLNMRYLNSLVAPRKTKYQMVLNISSLAVQLLTQSKKGKHAAKRLFHVGYHRFECKVV